MQGRRSAFAVSFQLRTTAFEQFVLPDKRFKHQNIGSALSDQRLAYMQGHHAHAVFRIEILTFVAFGFIAAFAQASKVSQQQNPAAALAKLNAGICNFTFTLIVQDDPDSILLWLIGKQ